eukprot:1435817-Pyramimonas_sp.AAC.1
MSAFRFWLALVAGLEDGPAHFEFRFERPLHPSSPDAEAPHWVQQTMAPWASSPSGGSPGGAGTGPRTSSAAARASDTHGP